MGVVIGYTSSFTVGDACATNVSWDMQPNTERYFCLDGKFTPVFSVQKPTVSVNATVYAPGPSVAVPPSEACDTLNMVCNVNIEHNLTSCGDAVSVDIPTSLMVTSYSYSKEDNLLPGEESWSLQTYVGDNLPTYIIRGISEGSSTDGDTGVALENTDASASSGNVSAEGVGRADNMKIGTVSSVGGGSSAQGFTGQGSASINYTPLWV
jgi:hypothetical protein